MIKGLVIVMLLSTPTISLVLAQGDSSPRLRPPARILQARTAWRTSKQSEIRAVFRNDSRSKNIERVSGSLILLDGVTHDTISYPISLTYEFSKPLPPGKSGEGVALLKKNMPEMRCSKFNYEPLPDYVDRGFFAGTACTKDIFTLYVEEIQYTDKTTWKPTRKNANARRISLESAKQKGKAKQARAAVAIG